ncbi:hypothetical protein O181_126494 [Austropuccinia psidii MF-1]|uniref:Uncharacterized protein n=1 Tax=Austropuccinia psidii MF-1 TaxID=1389203 RepID=A0A9Q3KW58_9BASI|nr:hypothetical protein [Austropuccinia psidii MF-1]
MSEADEADRILWINWPESEINEENQDFWINSNFQVFNNEDQILGLPLIEKFEIPSYHIIPFIEYEDIFANEELPQGQMKDKWDQLPGSRLTRLEFIDILTYDGIMGNLANDYWNKKFYMEQDTRKSLY